MNFSPEGLQGKMAPDFYLPDETGSLHHLSDYKGQYLLLYFYPKDMTPGCTTEAQCFRDRKNDLKNYNVQVLGVSADSIESHLKFKEAHHLNFPLLSDTTKEVLQKYGVFVEKEKFGKKYMGIRRDSFLIDPEGVVVKHYIDVKPQEHIDEILRDLSTHIL
ncbi:thioredoxin-dependent thiol peroxidase [Candidatus Peregrinibacteria bacterium]|nr:thioredoxin-dependent thiol peroxidase [Candidatus Peregrinibacteria bacterium]